MGKERFIDCPTIVIDWDDIENENFTPSDVTIYEIHKDGVKFEFLLNYLAQNNQAVIFGNGAIGSFEVRFSFPLFQRGRWFSDMICNGIWYFDPTVYLGTCRLGWGYGTNKRWYLEEIYQIIKVILKKWNISTEDTLFCGSSGGGYTSILLAAMMQGKAAAINPQFNILECSASSLDKLRESCLLPNEEFCPERMDIFYYIKKYGYFPQIFVKQNLQASRDLEKQLLPFVTNVSNLRFDCENRVSIEFYNAEGGHNTMPGKEETLRWIEELLDKPLIKMPLIKATGYLINDNKLYFYLLTDNKLFTKEEIPVIPYEVENYTFSFSLKRGWEQIGFCPFGTESFCVFKLPPDPQGTYKVSIRINDGKQIEKCLAKGIEISDDFLSQEKTPEEMAFIKYLDEKFNNSKRKQMIGFPTSYNIADGKMIFRIDTSESELVNNMTEYAFWLLKDKEPIFKLGYSLKNYGEFDLPPNGTYRLKYYIKNGNEKTSYMVNNIIINEQQG